MSDEDDVKEMKAWAEHALKGLTDATVFVGVHNEGEMGQERIEFLLQLGYSIMQGKTIIIPVPYGVVCPPKLEAVADKVVRYHLGDSKSLATAIRSALHELGGITH